MVIVARSRSVNGPWQNCPHNPIVRTTTDAERWWSRGHATLFEGPDGAWWMVYHGYENGYRTLGRQTLLDRVEWTADGWPRAVGGDLSRPLAKPVSGTSAARGIARSTIFHSLPSARAGAFTRADPDEMSRARIEAGSLAACRQGRRVPPTARHLRSRWATTRTRSASRWDSTATCRVACCCCFDDRLYLGMGHDGTRMTSYRGGKAATGGSPRRRHASCI